MKKVDVEIRVDGKRYCYFESVTFSEDEADIRSLIQSMEQMMEKELVTVLCTAAEGIEI